MEAMPQEELEQRARELQARLAPKLEHAKATLSDWNTRVTTFVRQNPGTCLLGALAVGYVVGKLASRR
ncbi:MAG: hypothetical protein ACOZIN_21430 [Myxococcota bacterium]